MLFYMNSWSLPDGRPPPGLNYLSHFSLGLIGFDGWFPHRLIYIDS
jgi:hypothetical protein